MYIEALPKLKVALSRSLNSILDGDKYQVTLFRNFFPCLNQLG